MSIPGDPPLLAVSQRYCWPSDDEIRAKAEWLWMDSKFSTSTT